MLHAFYKTRQDKTNYGFSLFDFVKKNKIRQHRTSLIYPSKFEERSGTHSLGKPNRSFLVLIPFFLLFFLFFVSPKSAFAATYYVDGGSLGGSCSNSNPGTSLTSPWCTINKAATSTTAGDTIYIRGATYRETITFSVSGTSTSPITFSKYQNESPAATGTDTVTGWTLDSGSRYYATLAGATTTTVVLENGTKLTSASSVAEVDSNGEWFHDTAANRLYVQTSTGASPSGFTIEASRRALPVRLTGSSYIVWDGIDVYGGNSTTGANIFASSGSNNTIKNLRTYASGAYGVNINHSSQVTGWTFENVTANYNTINGIRLQNSTATNVNTTVRNSTAHNNGEAGIWIENGSGSLVENNTTYLNNPGSDAAANNDGITIKTVTNPITRYNISYSNGGEGIAHRGGSGGQVYYNLSYKNEHHGFDLTNGGTGYTFYNNTSVNNGDASDDHAFYHKSGGAADSNLTLKNNIFIGSFGRAMTFDNVDGTIAGVTSNYNLLYQEPTALTTEVVRYNGVSYTSLSSWQANAISPDANSVSSDPLWSNEPSDNYRLTVSSPAVNSGTSVSLTQDILGNTVPQGSSSDMGAYEYVAASTSSTSSSAGPIHCGNTAPTKAPQLFRITTTANNATLYFAPAGHPVTYYFIAFGYDKNDVRFGGIFSYGHSDGAIPLMVNHLTPNTTYYFRVRGGNGCMPGNWSNTLKATTTGKKTVKRITTAWEQMRDVVEGWLK